MSIKFYSNWTPRIKLSSLDFPWQKIILRSWYCRSQQRNTWPHSWDTLMTVWRVTLLHHLLQSQSPGREHVMIRAVWGGKLKKCSQHQLSSHTCVSSSGSSSQQQCSQVRKNLRVLNFFHCTAAALFEYFCIHKKWASILEFYFDVEYFQKIGFSNIFRYIQGLDSYSRSIVWCWCIWWWPRIMRGRWWSWSHRHARLWLFSARSSHCPPAHNTCQTLVTSLAWSGWTDAGIIWYYILVMLPCDTFTHTALIWIVLDFTVW